jgi:hypothetical protein
MRVTTIPCSPTLPTWLSPSLRAGKLLIRNFKKVAPAAESAHATAGQLIPTIFAIYVRLRGGGGGSGRNF